MIINTMYIYCNITINSKYIYNYIGLIFHIRIIFAARFYPAPRADPGIEEAQRIKAEKDAGSQHGVSISSVEFPCVE